jgi:hypothetical protein
VIVANHVIYLEPVAPPYWFTHEGGNILGATLQADRS